MATEPDKEALYRFVVDGIGIYEAVDRDCPKDSPLREGKPDGSWLPRVGEKYPGGSSYWTEFGAEQYMESGLLDWHLSVVQGRVQVERITRPKEVLCEDEYQVIVRPEVIESREFISLPEWRHRLG